MASPTPDAAASDPKSKLDKEEKKSELNGHASPSESKTETKAETKTDAKAVPEEKPDDKPSKSKQNDESSTESATTNGIATPADGDKNSSGDKNTPPPAERASVDTSEKKSPEKTEEAKTETEKKKVEDEASKKTAKSEEPASKSTASEEDVQMTDAASNNDAAEPPRDADAAKTSPKSKSPAKEADPDTVMTDEPAEKKEDPKDSKTEDPEALPTSEVDLGPASMSQLAIDGTENTSPVEHSIEVSVADAPSTKVPRERDEEADDERAPKRAKTEPKEEDVAASNAGTPAPTADGEQRLSSLEQWEDAETDAKPLSQHQRREIRKVIARVKKTKHGGHFRDAVVKLWPVLSENYTARIDKPMDLSEIDRNLRDANGVYKNFGDMRKDLALIYENTLLFNGPSHEVTVAAFFAIRAVWTESLAFPEDEPTRPKSVAKPKPPREHRAIPGVDAARRQSSGPASSPPPREVVEPKPRPAPAPEPPVERRSSTATAEADRPKRTVRAPKPKDIDYTTKPSRKKFKPELQFGDEVLTELMHQKNAQLNTWFMDPVDAEGLNIPTYYAVIKKPMDLNKIARLLASGEISSLKELDRSIRLIFSNCYQFNGPVDQGNPVSVTAKSLEDLYNSLMKGKDAWLSKYAKANAPTTSNASEEEEESEPEEAAAPAIDHSKDVQELVTKLDEENKKLTQLFAQGAQQGAIDCQKIVVQALQTALHKAASTMIENKNKEKATKKSTKSSKTKSSSNPGHRKSLSGVPQSKKSALPKKPPPKKTLSAADKDQIASAINDLEYPHLDRAIDIIKRDTGQNENNDGELELDIDQLSNEALLKLWDLCKKVLPGFSKDTAVVSKTPEVHRSAPAKQTPKNASAKPKKNKPMSAQEQEARIAQLTAISQLYRPGQEPGDGTNLATSPNAGDSSDDSDSEEE